MRSFRSHVNSNLNPRATANWISVLTFWYTFKIFKVGRKRELNETDLTEPLLEHKSSILGKQMAKIWCRERVNARFYNKNPSVLKVIWQCFKFEITKYGFIVAIMELGIRIFQPFFLGAMLRYFEKTNETNHIPSQYPMYLNRIFNYWAPNQSHVEKNEMLFFASGVIITSIIPTMILHPYMMGVTHLGMKIRIACSSLIYRKALRINLASLGGETGNCVNLLANDVYRFDITPLFVHYIWVSPLQTLLCTYCLWREIQEAGLLGILSILVFIPVLAFLTFKTVKFRQDTAIKTDERLRETNELVQGIEVIKMYGWEFPLANRIHKIRKEEMKPLRKTSYVRGLFMSFILFTTRLGIFLSCLSHVLLGGILTPPKMFFIVAHYFILRQTMTVYFPQGVAQVAEAYVSVKRIEKFMNTPETQIGDSSVLDPNHTLQVFRNVTRNDLLNVRHAIKKGIFIDNIIVNYGEQICINGLTANINIGELTTVIGPVGAGKSSLLNTLLGELVPLSGNVEVKGIMSYASQEPWLFSGSVRSNIIFGEKFERSRYREVVAVCALVRDFNLLPFGDRTIVGERGTSLSGGQRARVNLARAVYKNADIYLLDDPLSAVDASVALQLFENCIKSYLSSKAVLLVTHQVQFLQRANNVLVMEDGNILGFGSYNDLLSQGINFTRLLEVRQDLEQNDAVTEPTEPKMRSSLLVIPSKISSIDLQTETEEMRTYGSMKFNIYKQYFRSGGNWCLILFIAFMFVFTQVLASSCDVFVAKWAQLENMPANKSRTESMGIWGKLSRHHCIIAFSVLITCNSVFAVTRSLLFYTACIKASIRLHDRMFESILHAKMKFFYENPSGRILNRFSKDVAAVDEGLPTALIDTVQIFLNLCGALCIMVTCDYFLVIPTAVVVILFIVLRSFYLKTSRSVKRLDSVTRSPIITHLNATIQGITTVRSEGKESLLLEEFDDLQDVQSSANFYFLCTSRAFGYWLDMICCGYITVVTLYYAFMENVVEGPYVGLAVTQAIGLIGVFQWGMRQSAELESQMTSVERELEFIKNVEHEANLESLPGKKPPSNWPKYGEIQFIDFSLKYDPSDNPVLKNLNLLIQPKEKIGIVGRTGAGKSTFISSLFRLAYESGQLMIDGVDIGEIGLHDLRKVISIIPQEPVLFSGTLRHNLDPFNEYKDRVLVSALVDVEIKVAVTEGAACLKLMIKEGGINLSVGQRQLICLARAIVRNNKILVMDEATANVDPLTEQLIQHTIRLKFANCTVFTIAHRLSTVIDYDRILVIDAGKVIEFDHPHILLQNQNGLLSFLVSKTGKSMAEELKRRAENSYLNKQRHEELSDEEDDEYDHVRHGDR